MNNPIISLEGVEKRFGSNLVVKAIGMRKDNNNAYDRRF